MAQIGIISIACRARRVLPVRRERRDLRVCKDLWVTAGHQALKALRGPPVPVANAGWLGLQDQ